MENKPVVICIIGPTAAGKETQAKLLAQSLHFPLVKIDTLLRDAALTDSRTGIELRQIIKSGSIIKPKVIKPFLEELIHNHDKPGFVMAGFPRTTEQAELVVSFRDDIKRLVVAELQLKPEQIKARIKERASHTNHKPGVDDNLDLVEEKLILYDVSKLPIQHTLVGTITSYKNVNYFQVNADQPARAIHQEIQRFVQLDLAQVGVDHN